MAIKLDDYRQFYSIVKTYCPNITTFSPYTRASKGHRHFIVSAQWPTYDGKTFGSHTGQITYDRFLKRLRLYDFNRRKFTHIPVDQNLDNDGFGRLIRSSLCKFITPTVGVDSAIAIELWCQIKDNTVRFNLLSGPSPSHIHLGYSMLSRYAKTARATLSINDGKINVSNVNDESFTFELVHPNCFELAIACFMEEA